MSHKTVYVINYKETTIDSDNVMDVQCGTCEWGYDNLEDAIKKVYELTDNVINENIESFEELNGYRDTNDNGDSQTVTIGNNTYEYWVLGVGIM